MPRRWCEPRAAGRRTEERLAGGLAERGAGVEVPGHVMPFATAGRRPVPRAAGAVGEACVALSAEPP
ncbi:hypothetical protein ACFWN5_43480 [Streptomyces sp. NPDC058430]|uniref:hypothetical protein n=1 Tax=Streptomyces sp. NPDC058430 TaxID=3346495 RepID=UPI0036697819